MKKNDSKSYNTTLFNIRPLNENLKKHISPHI